MRTFIILSIAGAAAFSSCNNNNATKENTSAKSADTTQSTKQTAGEVKSTTPISDIVAGYIQLKNGLANDNGNEAANGGKFIVSALAKVDKASLSADQKKAYEDVADDVKENAEHISENAGKLDHQREHFEMLSKDVYDLVKTFGAGQTLYQDFCPMYNDKKGAAWLSETKEIKNPYMGQKMATCGSVKEELK
jgi:hypothetical protein